MLKLQIRKRVNRRIKADISLTEKTENIHPHHLSKVHRDRKMDKDKKSRNQGESQRSLKIRIITKREGWIKYVVELK